MRSDSFADRRASAHALRRAQSAPPTTPTNPRAIFLPDGKILMGGTSLFSLLTRQDQLFFRRFNSDGSLDTTFGNGGTVMGNLPFTTAMACRCCGR
jgi:hypothetical protein